MKIVVSKPFDGVLDGAIYPKHFNIGDIVEGDLARVAVEQGWASEADEGPPEAIEVPANWETFNAADTVALARALGADDGIKTKAAATEFVAAEIAKRAAEAQG